SNADAAIPAADRNATRSVFIVGSPFCRGDRYLQGSCHSSICNTLPSIAHGLPPALPPRCRINDFRAGTEVAPRDAGGTRSIAGEISGPACQGPRPSALDFHPHRQFGAVALMESHVGTARPLDFVDGNEIDHALLLGALQAMRNGDFSVRLPGNWTGLARSEERRVGKEGRARWALRPA